MHPVKTFAWADEQAMRAFVQTHGFAQISLAHEGRVMAAHAPLVAGPEGAFDFHIARANVVTPLLDGAPVLATILGEEAYVSPDWYGTANQVPTWNYRLVEIEGTAHRLDDAELTDILDRLSAAQEAQLAPKTPWTMAKMDPAAVTAMLRGIVGFRIAVSEMRGVEKLGQNKSAAERAGAIAGLRGQGEDGVANLMERTLSPLPVGEREGPAAKRWEGEGDAAHVTGTHPLPSHDAPHRGPLPSPPRGEGA